MKYPYDIDEEVKRYVVTEVSKAEKAFVWARRFSFALLIISTFFVLLGY